MLAELRITVRPDTVGGRGPMSVHAGEVDLPAYFYDPPDEEPFDLDPSVSLFESWRDLPEGGRRSILIGYCACGSPGCGDVEVLASRTGASIEWSAQDWHGDGSASEPEPVRFDAEQYLAEVLRAERVVQDQRDARLSAPARWIARLRRGWKRRATAT